MPSKKIKAGIYGAGGLTGRELLKLLKHHPGIEITHITSNLYAGKTVGSVFPELGAYCKPHSATNLCFSKHSGDLPADIEFLFLAVPNETSLELLPKLIDKKIKCVDLSGSFRLNDQKIWENYYKLKHTSFEYMDKVVFGIPEIFRDQIKKSTAISNPGCYPTGPIIALNTISRFADQMTSIVIDAKSGISGAGGRTEGSGFQYQDIHENFRAYKVLSHQHQPEIQEYCFAGFSEKFNGSLVFIPHLLPIHRGILSTIVIHWKNKTPENIKELLVNKCQSECFMRYYNDPAEIELRNVAHTNFVDISIKSDENTSIIIIAIDNLVKGAAGQAIQNMNLILGFAENTALI